MNKTIIFCEGKNDKLFIYNTIIRKLNFVPSQIKHYENPSSFIRDVRNNNLKKISILEGGGAPNYIKLAVKLTRQLWNEFELNSIGVIGDSDRGSVYNNLVRFLQQYLATECKKHNVDPQVDINDSEYKLLISFKKGRQISMWSIQIPNTLEANLAVIIKQRYPEFRSVDDPHNLLHEASKKKSLSKEEFIKQCLKIIENEPWFRNFILDLKRNIEQSKD
ncbi:MAG: hypothetical protein ACTSRS_00290 [Candidatus Helarchaeota archaeon]